MEMARGSQATIGALFVGSNTLFDIGDRSIIQGNTIFDGPGDFRWSGGTIKGTFKVAKGSTLTLTGNEEKTFDASGGSGRLERDGMLLIQAVNEGVIVLQGGGRLSFRPGGSALENLGTFRIASDAELLAYNCCSLPNRIVNMGVFQKDNTAAVSFKGIFLENHGNFNSDKGSIKFYGGGEFSQEAGITRLDDVSLSSENNIVIADGAFEASGIVKATLINSGTVSPGLSGQQIRTGKLTIIGDYKQQAKGELLIHVAGQTAGSTADLLEVQGDARLHGKRIIRSINGFRPGPNAKVEIVRYEQRHGTFYDGEGIVGFPVVYQEPVVVDATRRKPGSILLDVNGPHSRQVCQTGKFSQSNAIEAVRKAQGVLETWPTAGILIAEIFPGDQRVVINTTEFAQNNNEKHILVLGRAERSSQPLNNRDRVTVRFAWSKLSDIIHLAVIMIHEFRHARDILSHGFTLLEAAPFLTQKEYVIYTLNSEFEAFYTAATSLEQLADIDPRYEVCRMGLLKTETALQEFALADTEAAQREITATYMTNLSASYSHSHNVSSTRLSELADVKPKVESMKSSTKWQDTVKHWEPICKRLFTC